MGYNVKATKTFEKEFRRKHKGKKNHLGIIISKLEKHPGIYGKPLGGHLHGIWQIRLGDQFRVWYEIDEVGKGVTLKAVLHKEEAKKLTKVA